MQSTRIQVGGLQHQSVECLWVSTFPDAERRHVNRCLGKWSSTLLWTRAWTCLPVSGGPCRTWKGGVRVLGPTMAAPSPEVRGWVRAGVNTLLF